MFQASFWLGLRQSFDHRYVLQGTVFSRNARGNLAFREVHCHIFRHRGLLIPGNTENQHWWLVYVDNVSRTVTYYCSLGGLGKQASAVEKIIEYLQREWAKRFPGTVCPTYVICAAPKDLPLQTNGFDCGPFICSYAKYIFRGVAQFPADLPTAMHYWRKGDLLN